MVTSAHAPHRDAGWGTPHMSNGISIGPAVFARCHFGHTHTHTHTCIHTQLHTSALSSNIPGPHKLTEYTYPVVKKILLTNRNHWLTLEYASGDLSVNNMFDNNSGCYVRTKATIPNTAEYIQKTGWILLRQCMFKSFHNLDKL